MTTISTHEPDALSDRDAASWAHWPEDAGGYYGGREPPRALMRFGLVAILAVSTAIVMGAALAFAS